MSNVISQIALFMTEGSSDKVYNVQLCEESDGICGSIPERSTRQGAA